MLVRERRKQQTDSVNQAYERLKDCLAGEFAPGYFNSPEALAAEGSGLEICDAVLGHVLATPSNTSAEARALELLNRVSKALVAGEVENRCHNLHGACALMLDLLNIPVVEVWGSVYATDKEGRAFWLNVMEGSSSEDHRPGHSWLLTPSWRVADLALVHQAGVPGRYNDIRATLTPVITATASEASEPDESWWRFESGHRLTEDEYADATRYHDVIGWSQLALGSTTLRYLPTAMSLPSEADLAIVDIKIGGLSPKDFFDQNASDLLRS